MDRRVFIQMISALGLAPKLPALSMNAAAPLASPAVSYTASQYAMGSYYLESRGARSALELGKWLQVNPASAELLMGDLLKNGVAAPLADGLARAVNPLSSANEKLDSEVFSKANKLVENLFTDGDDVVQNLGKPIEIVKVIEEESIDATT